MNKINLLKILFLFLLFIIPGQNLLCQNYKNKYKPRSTFYTGIYGGIGFSKLHNDNIKYQYYEGSYVDRKTISSEYLSYGFGVFADIYVDSLKTFGLSLDVSFCQMGYKDRIYDETFRNYYIIVAPKLISWTQKNFFVAAGWYFAFLVDTALNSNNKLINSWDHGVLVDWGFNQVSNKVLTRTGFKIYISLKNIYTKWNINEERKGEPEGYNFTVHFYVSFVFSII